MRQLDALMRALALGAALILAGEIAHPPNLQAAAQAQGTLWSTSRADFVVAQALPGTPAQPVQPSNAPPAPAVPSGSPTITPVSPPGQGPAAVPLPGQQAVPVAPAPQGGGPGLSIRVDTEPVTPPPSPPPAPGQPPPPPGQPVQPSAVQPPPQGAGPPTISRGTAFRGGQVSFNFDDADIYSVIQTIFGEVLRVNYIVDPRVKGRVTFRSTAPVPRENALPLMEVILRLNGVGVVEEKGLYRILPLSEVAREPSSVQFGRNPQQITLAGKILFQVVPIVNIQSSEVVKLLTPFLSASAVLIDVPRGNQIIIVDTDANVKRLLELVQIFDGEQFKRRKTQVFVYNVQNSKARDVAALLQQIFLGASAPRTASDSQAGPGAPQAPRPIPGPTVPPPPTSSSMPQVSTVGGGSAVGLVSEATRIFHDEIINSVVVVATPEDYEIIKEAIQKIDIVPRQVVIEGVVASINLTDSMSLGLAWSFKTKWELTGNAALNPGVLTNPAQLSQTGFNYVGVDDKGVVRAAISALASDSKAKLLAAPHILVADNRQARIQVGQQVPLVVSETYGTPGVAPQQAIQYKDIGIILKVKPQVNESGLVALELNQEVSTFQTIKLYVDSTQIIINKSEASTNLVVQDGQTIVIGGLIREDTSVNRSGIPYLNRIPLIGWLFGDRSTDSTRTEIIILLTPHVIRTQKDAKEVTSDYVDRFTDATQGKVTKEELIKPSIQKNSETPSPYRP